MARSIGKLMTDNYLRDWKTLKPLILSKWTKLKSSDLEDMPTNAENLTHIIHSKYPTTPRETILQEVINLNDQIEK
ncbi:MAG: hypothetical protein WD595_00875 [Waddliaceae bacterium]